MSTTSSDMAVPVTDNLASPFLALPSLVRDEIYRHLLPEDNAIWLSRKACVPKPPTDQSHARFLTAEFYAAFWQRRQLEHRAISHWYPRQTGFPTEAHLESDRDGYMYGRNGQDVKDYLALRLVCRKVCVEASALLFRAITLWWTIWDSEIAMVRDLIKLESLGLADDKWCSSGDIESVTPICTTVPPGGIERVTAREWNDFIRKRKNQALLMWISRFRRVNIVTQESHFTEVLHAVQAMLRLPNPHRLPAFHFVACGFKLYFDQGLNTWEPLIPWSVTSSYRLFDIEWHGQRDSPGVSKEVGSLNVGRIKSGGEYEDWAPDGSEFWSDAFKFCNIPFKADASFRDLAVDLSGSLIFYKRKNQPSEPDKSQEQQEIWSG